MSFPKIITERNPARRVQTRFLLPLVSYYVIPSFLFKNLIPTYMLSNILYVIEYFIIKMTFPVGVQIPQNYRSFVDWTGTWFNLLTNSFSMYCFNKISFSCVTMSYTRLDSRYDYIMIIIFHKIIPWVDRRFNVRNKNLYLKWEFTLQFTPLVLTNFNYKFYPVYPKEGQSVTL